MLDSVGRGRISKDPRFRALREGLHSKGLSHVVLDSLSEYDPDDSHELVRERDDRFVLASSRHEIPDPSALRMRVFVRPAHDSTSAVDEQDSQRPITIFGDAAELNATARAVLPWH